MANHQVEQHSLQTYELEHKEMFLKTLYLLMPKGVVKRSKKMQLKIRLVKENRI